MPFTAGLPETGCGAGSTVAFTHGLREALPVLFRELNVSVLLDAPCGDFNWMSRVDLSGVTYIGYDYDGNHCKAVLAGSSQPEHYRPIKKAVMQTDICNSISSLGADMMLCRDFLQHLPNADVSAVLRNFWVSQIPWLLATSHSNFHNEDIPNRGMFRPVNLTVAPFNLPPPMKTIPDGPGRILGLWHRNEMT